MSISNKQCTKCLIHKDCSEFSKNKTKSDGLQVWCKACRKIHDAAFYSNNTEKISLAHNIYKENNKKPLQIAAADYYQRNKDTIAEKQRIRYTDNREQFRATQNKSEKKRLAENVGFLLKKRLRIRLNSAIKNDQKKGSAVVDLGCTVQHLKLHLELFWDAGMSWSNYGFGNGKWNIDHIVPLSTFDLTNRDQFLRAVHYTNLQPLWHVDNQRKSDTVIVN